MSSTTPVRIAVIGCGVIGRHHVRAFASLGDAVVSALCDLSPASLNSLGDEFQIFRRTSSAAEILQDPAIDAVVLAMPTGVRTLLAIDALKAGKHVLLEKPVAMNVAEVDQLEAARGDRVVACCSGRYSCYPSAGVAREFIASGRLGAIRSISCRGIIPPARPAPDSPPPWRLSRKLNGGGILVNWGSYDLDYLFGMLPRLNPVHAFARCWSAPTAFSAYAAPGSDAETHVAALVGFDNGALLDYERAEFIAAPAESRWQIVGENGTLSLQMTPRDDARIIWSHKGESAVVDETLWQGDETSLDATALVDADFIRAIRGSADPMTDLRKSRLIQQITDAIYASADSAAPVAIPQVWMDPLDYPEK